MSDTNYCPVTNMSKWVKFCKIRKSFGYLVETYFENLILEENMFVSQKGKENGGENLAVVC